jgi:hypothetical protein
MKRKKKSPTSKKKQATKTNHNAPKEEYVHYDTMRSTARGYD